jgi:hypothetical protein
MISNLLLQSADTAFLMKQLLIFTCICRSELWVPLYRLYHLLTVYYLHSTFGNLRIQ